MYLKYTLRVNIICKLVLDSKPFRFFYKLFFLFFLIFFRFSHYVLFKYVTKENDWKIYILYLMSCLRFVYLCAFFSFLSREESGCLTYNLKHDYLKYYNAYLYIHLLFRLLCASTIEWLGIGINRIKNGME